MTVQTFGWKSKRVAGMAIGAIAMLAVAAPALAQAPDTDAFKVTAAIKPNNTTATSPFISFDISWFDPKLKKYFLADRSNNQIDVVDPRDNSITNIGHGLFAGPVACNPPAGANDCAGPDGVLTVHRGEDEDEGGVTELWVGDSPGKVWVLNAVTGANILGDKNSISVGGTTSPSPHASRLRGRVLLARTMRVCALMPQRTSAHQPLSPAASSSSKGHPMRMTALRKNGRPMRIKG